MRSPPGRGSTARPVRASRAGTSRMEPRILDTIDGSGSSSLSVLVSRLIVLSGPGLTHTPRRRSPSSRNATSRMRGTVSIAVSPEARSDAARTGSASFLLPAGVTVPQSGRPPSTMKRSAERSFRWVIVPPDYITWPPAREARSPAVSWAHDDGLYERQDLHDG